MSIGIAFSGGGVSAAISAACAWNSIVESYPYVLDPPDAIKKVTVSTVSGGSIGFGLWVNAKDRIQFTRYNHNMSLEELLFYEEPESAGQNETSLEAWHNFFFNAETRTNFTDCDEVDVQRTVGRIAGDLFSPMFLKQFVFKKGNVHNSHWWRSMIQGVFHTLCVDEIRSGDISWLTSFAFYNQSVVFDRSSDQGSLSPSSVEFLHQVIVNMNNGYADALSNKHGGKVPPKISTIDALSYSSAFWASNVLANNMINLFFNNMLMRPSIEFIESDRIDKSDVVLMDGGVIDTTGIVGLLKQKKDHIVAFYNNNVPLSSVLSPIAYLFGVDAATDVMNSLKGPLLSQVFPSHLYPSVIRNLTDTKIGVAHLTDIDIVQNRMGVDPYTLSSLVLFSNGKMSDFQFNDKRILQELSPQWPDQFSYGLPTLDANALCAFNDYKVKVMLRKENLL